MADDRIPTACPNCARVQLYAPEGRGRKGRCRGCGTAYKIGDGARWSPSKAASRPSETFPLILPPPEPPGPAGCPLCGSDADKSTFVAGVCPACYEKQSVEPEVKPAVAEVGEPKKRTRKRR